MTDRLRTALSHVGPVGHPDHAPIPNEYVSRARYEHLERTIRRLEGQAEKVRERLDKAERLLRRSGHYCYLDEFARHLCHEDCEIATFLDHDAYDQEEPCPGTH